MDDVLRGLEREIATDRPRRRLVWTRRAVDRTDDAMAFGPSSARATSGPEMMNSTSPAKNGFSRCAV
jgi:hypothetical protein